MGQSPTAPRSRAPPLFELALDLPPAGAPARGRKLRAQLEAAIRDGRLAPGAKLPATRLAQAVFGVSRNTLADIYERLALEGLVASRRGSGAYVAERPAPARPERPAPAAAPDLRLNPAWRDPALVQSLGFWREAPDEAADPDAVDFRPALVDWSLFPFDVFRQVSARQLRALERRPARLKSPQGNQGTYALRRALTQHIALTRAVVCDPADVLVTSGAQQAFDLLARTLVTPGRTVVAVEDPGYPPLRAAFLAAGARLVPVPVDDEGPILDRIPAEAALICVCPSHQFPLGITMSPARRQALVALARARGAVIVEDDYDGEFRFDDAPVAALRGEDAGDVVFYVGTFSKCMIPALRLGFVVAPAWAMPTLVLAKNAQDWHCSTPLQVGVAAFIAEGHLARHVRRMREAYGARRAKLLGALRGELAPWLEPVPSVYGLHLAARTREGVDAEAVADALLDRQVKVHTLSRYFLGAPSDSGFVLGYGAANLDRIDAGLDRLKAVLSA